MRTDFLEKLGREISGKSLKSGFSERKISEERGGIGWALNSENLAWEADAKHTRPDRPVGYKRKIVNLSYQGIEVKLKEIAAHAHFPTKIYTTHFFQAVSLKDFISWIWLIKSLRWKSLLS